MITKVWFFIQHISHKLPLLCTTPCSGLTVSTINDSDPRGAENHYIQSIAKGSDECYEDIKQGKILESDPGAGVTSFTYRHQ